MKFNVLGAANVQYGSWLETCRCCYPTFSQDSACVNSNPPLFLLSHLCDISE